MKYFFKLKKEGLTESNIKQLFNSIYKHLLLDVSSSNLINGNIDIFQINIPIRYFNKDYTKWLDESTIPNIINHYRETIDGNSGSRTWSACSLLNIDKYFPNYSEEIKSIFDHWVSFEFDQRYVYYKKKYGSIELNKIIDNLKNKCPAVLLFKKNVTKEDLNLVYKKYVNVLKENKNIRTSNMSYHYDIFHHKKFLNYYISRQGFKSLGNYSIRNLFADNKLNNSQLNKIFYNKNYKFAIIKFDYSILRKKLISELRNIKDKNVSNPIVLYLNNINAVLKIKLKYPEVLILEY